MRQPTLKSLFIETTSKIYNNKRDHREDSPSTLRLRSPRRRNLIQIIRYCKKYTPMILQPGRGLVQPQGSAVFHYTVPGKISVGRPGLEIPRVPGSTFGRQP